MNRLMRSTKIARIYDSQAGMALATVLLIGLIMTLLVTATMAFAVNSLDLSRRDQDWNAALAAAEAGVDDYLYRLNRIDAYWQYSATNPPPPAVDVNDAFTQWVPVPGDANDAKFRYKVDSTSFATDGSIKLTSTGLVRNSTRTVHTTLRRRNFLDYLYFTDYETVDPAAYDTALGYPFNATTAQQECALHFYDPPGRDPQCRDINFISADVINGPLHSNDAILIAGNPRFLGATSTSWNDPAVPPKRWRKNPCCSSTPVFARAGDPKYDLPLEIPPSNTALKSYTDPALGETGCLFTGPTRILLNNNGTMTVTSPFTPSGGNCAWTAGTASQTKPIPANGVIYVQSVPAGAPNSNCTTHPLSEARVSNDITRYDCKAGDVFVRSVTAGFTGRLTIAAQNNIVITEDVKLSSLTGNDLLGLVADNYVEIYHPVRCTNFNRGVCTSGSELVSGLDDVMVHAAILSVKHSFRVQNYFMGSGKDQLSVRGAISQSYRGAVGTFSGSSVVTGYEKDYAYDQRLKYQSPPHFLDPVKSAWQVKTWSEIKPCYPSQTGAPRAGAPCT